VLCCLCETPLLARTMSHRTKGYLSGLPFLNSTTGLENPRPVAMNRIRTLDLYVYLPRYASIDHDLIHRHRNLPHYFKEYKIIERLPRRFIPGNAPECLQKVRVRIEISYLILCSQAGWLGLIWEIWWGVWRGLCVRWGGLLMVGWVGN
jgi:hypothetical protein